MEQYSPHFRLINSRNLLEIIARFRPILAMNPSQQRRDPNAIVPRGNHRLTAGDYFRRFMEETMREMDRAFSIGPYWESQPNLHECNIGNSVGSVSYPIFVKGCFYELK